MALSEPDNSHFATHQSHCAPAGFEAGFDSRVNVATHFSHRSAAFLQIPPFPGGRVSGLAVVSAEPLAASEAKLLLPLLRKLRVGGTYWAAQPALPNERVLARSADALEAARSLSDAAVLWPDTSDVDPWHMLSGAAALFTDGDDDLCLVAAILGVPVYRKASVDYRREEVDAAKLLTGIVASAYANPFTGESVSATEAVELCGFWRALIDSNREIVGALGFAFWKRDNVAPLLWNGADPVRFGDTVNDAGARAVWRSKAPAVALAEIEKLGTPVIEVEDGFLRSQGLGADCVPPLSITADRLGAYFDPARPSELERLLQEGWFDEDLLGRARRLRALIVAAGLGKYETGVEELERPAGNRRHILVPGQVEDDRSVLCGGGGLTSNLELLKRARAVAPDAFIVYKPHPDVAAGHRRGSLPERTCFEFADQMVIDAPISSLIGMVDEVHVNTSLAGFEALLRAKSVTTHGVPFYAGWGLTRDLGPVPARRTARRSLDELVAATLLLYPRYLDPVTGLPCPAEVVVERLTNGKVEQGGMVVAMRRLQGKVLRSLREMVQ